MGMLIDVGLVVFVSSAVSSGIVAFLASYLKKKGENLATKEDLNDLVKQVQAVTIATKEIESKISGDLWDRQKGWEAKRDALFDAIRSLSIVEQRFGIFRAVVKFGLDERPPEERLKEKLFEVVKEYHEAENLLEEAILRVDMICDELTITTLREVKKIVDQKSELLVKKDVQGADGLEKRYYRALYDFKCALRAELRISVVPVPQSVE